MTDELSLDSLVAAAVAGDRDAARDLAEYGRRAPAAIGGRLEHLFRAGVLYPPNLYRGSDDAVREGLVAAIDGSSGHGSLNLNHALLALANAGGDIAEEAFRRWSNLPPPGSERLYTPVADYTVEAGWVLLPSSGRRVLCGQQAYRLAAIANRHGPDPGVECPFCRNPLWVVIDLDLSDVRVATALAHTGWAGKLRVVTCQSCSCYGDLFCEVRSDGSSRWSDLSQRPSYLPTPEPQQPERPALTVAEARISAYLASAWEKGGSTLGGYPDWIQDAGYLRCPRCQDFMDHVVLVGGADIFSFGEGAYYVGLHARCGMAGVTYQQS